MPSHRKRKRSSSREDRENRRCEQFRAKKVKKHRDRSTSRSSHVSRLRCETKERHRSRSREHKKSRGRKRSRQSSSPRRDASDHSELYERYTPPQRNRLHHRQRSPIRSASRRRRGSSSRGSSGQKGASSKRDESPDIRPYKDQPLRDVTNTTAPTNAPTAKVPPPPPLSPAIEVMTPPYQKMPERPKTVDDATKDKTKTSEKPSK